MTRKGIENRDGFWLCEWEDETSQFDPDGWWNGSSYSRIYRMWIPDSIAEDDVDLLDAYIDSHLDDDDAWDRKRA